MSSLSPTTIMQLCIRSPIDAQLGTIIPPHLAPAILDPSGTTRISLVTDQDGKRLSQGRFCFFVGHFWQALSAIEREVLANQMLSPRAASSQQELIAQLGIGTSSNLEQVQAAAARTFVGQLSQRGITATLEGAEHLMGRTHYYFLPSPTSQKTSVIDFTGRKLSRNALESLVFDVLLTQHLITPEQALVGINAHVSVFPLNALELSTLLEHPWNQDQMQSQLAAFDDVLQQLGYTLMIPAPDQPFAAETESIFEMEPDQSAEQTVSGALQTDSSYQRIFELEIKPLSVPERIVMAGKVADKKLGALCLDPHPQVIAAVLDNPVTNVEHARLIATHHHSTAGLSLLLAKPRLIQNREVVRNLLRNASLQEPQINRLLSHIAFLEHLYRLSTSSEITAKARLMATTVLRQKFAAAQASEKFQLIVRTDGLCLDKLKGCRLDDATVNLLLNHNVFSGHLIQKLTPFPGVTTALKQHMNQHRVK